MRKAVFSRFHMGRSPEQLAKRVLRRGDPPVQSDARYFLRNLNQELQEIESAASALTRDLKASIAARVADREQVVRDEEARFALAKKTRQDLVHQAELWRSVGIQQRYAILHAGPAVRGGILVVIGVADYYVFAQAYAAVEDIAVYSSQWWLGGVFGLLALISGYLLAREIKRMVVGRTEKRMLEEMKAGTQQIEAKTLHALVDSRRDLLTTAVAAVIFTALTVAGMVVRATGATSSNGGVVTFTGLIPFMVIVSELFIYDPLALQEGAEPFRLRIRRRALLRAQHAAMRADEFEEVLNERIAAYGATARSVLTLKLKALAFDVEAIDENGRGDDRAPKLPGGRKRAGGGAGEPGAEGEAAPAES